MYHRMHEAVSDGINPYVDKNHSYLANQTDDKRYGQYKTQDKNNSHSPQEIRKSDLILKLNAFMVKRAVWKQDADFWMKYIQGCIYQWFPQNGIAYHKLCFNRNSLGSQN